MGWLSSHWEGMAGYFVLFLYITPIFTYDVHVYETDKPGSVIFNASFVSGWTFSLLNRHHSSQRDLNVLTLDTYTGILYLSESPQCLLQQHNPVQFQIVSSRTDSNNFVRTSKIPIQLFIHGPDCLIKYKRKSRLGVFPFETHFFSAQADQSFGPCIEKDTPLINLKEFLPKNLRQCSHRFQIDKEKVPFLEVDSTNGLIISSSSFCFELLFHLLDGSFEIIKDCNNISAPKPMPFQLMLYSNDIQTSPLVENLAQSIGETRQRLRRATNTPPDFEQKLFVKSVAEEQNPGVVIDTIRAIDPDSGPDGTLKYSLIANEDQRSQNMFTIDETSGQLKTTQKLNRESIDKHSFTVKVVDGGNPPLSAEASLQIHVDDVNDHSPEFENPSYTREIPEGTSPGSTVLTVRAIDEDFGQNAEIEYTILNPNGVDKVFAIDGSTGSITVKSTPDREEGEYYSLTIQASDKAQVTERRSATTQVEITILDENDNKPQFTKSSYTFGVREDIDHSSHPLIADIHATDADAGMNADIRYSITGGNNDGTFGIDAYTGELSVLKQLDYEETPGGYSLNVRAQDGGSPPKTNSVNVLIQVIDVNDNPPYFYTSVYHELVSEDVDVGHTIVRINAYDADAGDNRKLAYTIEDAPPKMPIQINVDNGYITTKAELDREVDVHYAFKVVATDHGDPAKSASARVDITILDVNDNAPLFNPRSYETTVSEEDSVGKPVIEVTATDEDENERIEYAITSGNIDGAFNIFTQMGSGLITVGKSLDYKKHNHYILTVTAVDKIGQSDTATVVINISDANTFSPEFKDTPYQVRINEDERVGTTVFTVLATDDDSGDNAKITYTMGGSEQFLINPSNGAITIQKALDREVQAGYTLTVMATDHGRPSKMDTTDVEVIVLDVNDNSPEFSVLEYRGEIDEDEAPGTSILTIKATDADEGMNGRIEYTFTGGDDGSGDFTIDSTVGVLRTAKELDRERVANYVLKVFAIDEGSSPRSTPININIKVLDVNDNAPQFETNKIHMYIDENSPIGSTVDTVRATDPDEGVNALVEYSIVGGPDIQAFSLKIKPGEQASIITMEEMDFEGDQNEYMISLQARSGHRFSHADVIIHVQDINDNIPIMKDFKIVVNNYEDHFPSGIIGRVPAKDPDVTDKLTYKVLSGNQANSIHLDEYEGVIQLDSRLNSDVPYNGTMLVSVTDGINEVRASAHLFVRLVTKDMLYHSITVRLNNIHAEAFLSSLFDLFISALSSIIPATPDNIFIVNVQDDTDVQEKVLNVSVSVRRYVTNNQDVFYSQEFLRERIYLERQLLARLSTLEVLPFDDNLCIKEMCLNLEHCVTILKFGEAAPFESSDTMLFRPIHPFTYFDCVCPPGFAGMERSNMCDIEVNLCYSNPCGNNGDCVQREGGYTCQCLSKYTGEHCEIDLEETIYEVCPVGVCSSTSQCAPLPKGGLQCEVCSHGNSADQGQCSNCVGMKDRTDFCELTTRSFTGGSFLVYTALKRRHRFLIELKFSTRESDGLLFYNGRFNEQHDFIALEIIEQQVQFSFSLGSEVTRVKATVKGGVSDGAWHKVTVFYLNRTATLTVGEDCDTEISLKYGTELGGYNCAAQVTQTLQEKCENPIVTCHRLLDLTGPFQLGGVASLPDELQIQSRSFTGCIQDVYMDHSLLDLDAYVWNNGTKAGCWQKNQYCEQKPCKNGGTCTEGWKTYTCDCPSKWGGKNCSQVIEAPQKLQGNGFLLYEDRKPNSQLPWYNGLAFRTRASTGTLMMVEVGEIYVKMELLDGEIQYSHPQKTVVLEDVLVNDGKWHFIEVIWMSSKLQLVLDYGQIQRSVAFGGWIVGETVNKVYVGGMPTGSENNVQNGFRGCVKDIRVGNGPTAILTGPTRTGAVTGCSTESPCTGDTCPTHAECHDAWMVPVCECEAGRLGMTCDKVCTHYNPCQGGSQCLQTDSGYVCKCKAGQSGDYCETEEDTECPSTWWGTSICGPCHCDATKGFNPECKLSGGNCVCKANHYKPADSDTCYPCQCYETGTINNSKACDGLTGQCHCKEGVVGRKCDKCTSKFAEVTNQGCKVRYEDCPRSFAGGMWWERVPFGSVRWQPCPNRGDFLGTVGNASRACSKDHGWAQPNMFSCTSRLFVELEKQVVKLEAGQLTLNTYLSKQLNKDVYSASEETGQLFGNDIYIAYRLLLRILAYENAQTGLNLTHTQDRYFIHYLVSSIGCITDRKFQSDWSRISHKTIGGSVALLHKLEEYVNTLAANVHQVFTQPFDAVHDNLVLGLDTIMKENMTSVVIPKYNNKVQDHTIFDDFTKIVLPVDRILTEANPANVDEILINNKPVASVGYLLFKNMGYFLPATFDKTIDVPEDIPLIVNTPVMSISVVDRKHTLTGPLRSPISIVLKQQELENRTAPHCVYWKYTVSNKTRGEWSTDGCRLHNYDDANSDKYITCHCDHMTSFAAVMAIYDRDLPATESIDLVIFSYIGFSLALICFTVGLVLFFCMRGMESNANSIHINLAFMLLLANLAFIVGITRVEPELGCKFVAIALHYFYLCTFSWLFVDILHLYRMITEIRNINQGSMKFYYMVGYIIPGIIVCLAVGLDTEGYGENGKFCWLETMSLLMWSYAAPVIFIVVLNFVVFILALKANCAAKKDQSEQKQYFVSLYAGLALLFIMGVTWIFGLLSVNDEVASFHYLFALFTFLQGVFLLLGYIVFNKQTRKDLKYTLHKLQGKKDLDDSISGTRTSMLSRSALAYNHHNDSSLDGGLNKLHNVGISTTSTTSRSTTDNSKGAPYRVDGYPQTSSSNSNIPPIKEIPDGVNPYGYGGRYREKPARGNTNKGLQGDSDSDSELSAMEHPDLELASSHSSDEDDEVAYPPWQQKPKNLTAISSKPSAKTRPIATVLPSTTSTMVVSNPPTTPQQPPQPVHSTPSVYVPPYSKLPGGPPPTGHPPPVPQSSHPHHHSSHTSTPSSPRVQWSPQQPLRHQRTYSPTSTSQLSSEEVKNPDHIKISNLRSSNDHSLHDFPYKGSTDLSVDERSGGVMSLPDHKSPGSPRDRVVVLTHNGSITSESEMHV